MREHTTCWSCRDCMLRGSPGRCCRYFADCVFLRLPAGFWWQPAFCSTRAWSAFRPVFPDVCGCFPCTCPARRAFVRRILSTCFRTSALGMLHLGGMALISLSVQLWLNPVMAFHFNRLSWISPVSNLLVVPLASLTLASGILAVLADCAALPSLVPLGIATWCAS